MTAEPSAAVAGPVFSMVSSGLPTNTAVQTCGSTDAVAQFARRDHTKKIFQHPFLYLAADTSDAMAATDPRKEENFRWYNMGLTNTPVNPKEYPVEFLYREVLSLDQLLEALSFFLIRVPEREAEEDKSARPASTIFPRYHQSRLVRRVAEDITAHFAA